jgi:tRNA(Ile)-lysidine synthase
MNQTVESFITAHCLIEPGDKIIVAVSGGPDSMALIHFLYNHYQHTCTIAAAHVEHGLRGGDSLKDMVLVRDFCENLQIPFYCFHPDIKALKREEKLSTQEAARLARYRWFKKIMDSEGANKLALAHHGDDQIETLLMRQVRGSYFGLQGIPVKRPFGRGMIIRPFLGTEKSSILNYCKENDVSYNLDKSNESEAYQRNRFRKHVLPFIKEENSKAHEAFQRQSEWFKEENEFLQSLAEEKLKQAVYQWGKEGIIVNIMSFLEIPIPLQRRAVHLILNYLSLEAAKLVTAKHLAGILTLMNKDSPAGTIHLPKGLSAVKSYNYFEFSFNRTDMEHGFPAQEIPIPGMVPLKKGKITASVIAKQQFRTEKNIFFQADYEKVSTPLFVRSRLNGDRITPLGMDGSKKLKDLFIDEKVPRDERNNWPVITDSKGNILWVPELRRSSIAPVSEHTEKILLLVYDMEDD